MKRKGDLEWGNHCSDPSLRALPALRCTSLVITALSLHSCSTCTVVRKRALNVARLLDYYATPTPRSRLLDHVLRFVHRQAEEVARWFTTEFPD